EPVLGVGVIAFAAMHDAVPEAARRRLDILADAVRFVEEIVDQPQSGEAAGRGFRVVDFSAWHELVSVEVGELRTQVFIRRTRVNFAATYVREQLGTGRTVAVGIERSHWQPSLAEVTKDFHRGVPAAGAHHSAPGMT